MKRILCFMLATTMLLGVLAGCSSGDSDTNSDTDIAAETDILTLVNEGISDYVIVRGANASASEVTASMELQSYLKQISGAELPIVTDDTAAVDKEIVVGKTNREKDGEFDRDELGDEGFIIKTEGEKLFLVGGEKRGTLYSIYTFLEDYLGCRYYTATVEKIPEMTTVSIPTIEEDKQIPVFENRSTDYLPKNAAWSVKQKINDNSFVNLTEELGGGIKYPGTAPGTETSVGFVHSMAYFISESEYFEEHPEYFSMGADRTRNTYQRCLTNPDVLEITIEKVRALLEANPDINIISVSQNDGGNPCMCEECQKIYEEEGSYSGAVIRFANAVADAIKDDYPNVKISTLAYQYTRDLPAVTKPRDNVIVRLCSIEICINHSIDSCTVVANKPSDSEISANSFYEDLQAWSKIADNIYIWHYTGCFSQSALSCPDFESLREDVQIYAENNVKGFFLQGNAYSSSGEFGELRLYLLSKILWNPYMTKEEYHAYMNDFLEGYYGEGWENIREFIDKLVEITADSHFGLSAKADEVFNLSTTNDKTKALPEELTYEMLANPETVDWTPYLFYYMTPNEETGAFIDFAYGEFEAAKALASDDEELARIDKSEIQVSWLELYYLSMVKTSIKYNLTRLCSQFFNGNENYTQDEYTSVRSALLKYIMDGQNEAYREKSEALFDKMLSYGVGISPSCENLGVDKANVNFDAVPDEWVD